MYKIIFVTQRPSIKQADNIGVWNGVLSVMAWLAIATNTFIMGMTSDQLECDAPYTHVAEVEWWQSMVPIYVQGSQRTWELRPQCQEVRASAHVRHRACAIHGGSPHHLHYQKVSQMGHC